LALVEHLTFQVHFFVDIDFGIGTRIEAVAEVEALIVVGEADG
jgi:hypothetical protein